jgi:arylsulfatase A-like enzyme
MGSCALAFTAAGCAGSLAKNPSNSSDKPNILFLFTDDQNFNTFSALENDEIKTPNMDKIIRMGTSFSRTYIMGSTHGAVCAPSRAMLLTGRTLFHLPETYTKPWAWDEEDKGKCPYITLPEVLRSAGYATFTTGKWHQEPPTLARGFTHAKNVFLGGMCNHLEVPLQDFDPTGEYQGDRSFKTNKFSSELFADAAAQFLRDFKEDKPFFAYVSFTAPHDPRMAPQKYVDMYPPENITLPKNFMTAHPFDNGQLKGRDERTAPFPRTPENIKKEIGAYYAMITNLDDNVGRILNALEASGKADNTIIILASDNGLAMGQHGLMGKQNLYEHSIRVPLVFAGPGIDKGASRDAICYLHDIFPTVCDLISLPIPASVESKSLVPVLKSNEHKLNDSLFFTFSTIHRAVRDEQYKLIEYFVKGKRTTQLFDLKADPWELNNLVDNQKYVGQLKRMRKILLRWKDKIDDPNEEFYAALKA